MSDRRADRFAAGAFTQRFALWSLAIMVAIAAVTGLVVTRIVTQSLNDEAERVTWLASNALMRHELQGHSLDTPLPSDVTRGLQRLSGEDLIPHGISAVKLWSTEGVLRFSSTPGDAIGQRLGEEQLFDVVRTGRPVTAVEESENGEDAHQTVPGQVMHEVYAPLGSAGSLLGVAELYLDHEPIEQRARSASVFVWLAVIAVAIPGYLVQLQFVRRAAMRLEASEASLVAVNERLATSLAELESHSLGTLQALAHTVDAKDSYTARHSLMVADYASCIAKELGIEESQRAVLERAALLHDIGKIATPEEILLKPARLTDEEFDIIKLHPVTGSDIVADIPFLSDEAAVIRAHHERFDGRGYPDGLKGEEIPLLSRILSVADTFDAMTSDRPYRKGMPLDAAARELEELAGGQLCPDAVPALLGAIERGDVVLGARHDKVART